MSAFYCVTAAVIILSVLITLFLGYHLTQTKIQMNGDPNSLKCCSASAVPKTNLLGEKNTAGGVNDLNGL